MSDANRPEFFMVFLPNYSSKRLKIPTEFVQHLEGRTSGSVILTGPSGNPWKVELMQKQDGLFFDEGWPTFVRDHVIDIGEFLLFTYDGDLRFTVTIYDRSACEKEAAFYAECSQQLDIIVNQEGNKRKRVQSDTASIEVLGDSPKKMRGKSPTKAAFYDHGACEKEAEFYPKCSQLIDTIGKLEGNKRERVELDTSSIKVLGDSPKQMRGNFPTKACIKRHGLSETDEQRTTKSFTTSHPSFVVRMTKFNVINCVLYIPTTFFEEHLLSYQSKEKIVFRNQKGKSWLVKILRKGNQYFFSAGMSSFVHNNNIKEGDICTFEFVDKCEFHVHLNRVNTEL